MCRDIILKEGPMGHFSRLSKKEEVLKSFALFLSVCYATFVDGLWWLFFLLERLYLEVVESTRSGSSDDGILSKAIFYKVFETTSYNSIKVWSRSDNGAERQSREHLKDLQQWPRVWAWILGSKEKFTIE